VDYLRILMAVLKSLYQLPKILPQLVIGEVLLLTQRAVLDILSDQVKLLMCRVINDFIQPHNIWMIQLFEDSHLSFHCLVCPFILGDEDLLELLLVHDLHGEKLGSVFIPTQHHLSKLPTPDV